MGAFRVPIEVGDIQGRRFESVEALVDTGSSYTLVPRSLLQRLGVTPEERWPFTLADGRTVEYDVAQVQVRLDGRRRYTVVVFGDDGAQCLLGVVTLEKFRLGVDPVSRRLIPVPGLLMLVSP
jgi:clan AA aspartic protease